MSSIGTTISGMTGRGSIRHNNRDFTAANVDRERSEQNIVFVNEDLKQVYRAWTKTNRVEGLDGSGKGRSDGDCPAA